MPHLILGSASKTDTMSEEDVERLAMLEGFISRPINRSLTRTVLQEPHVSIFTGFFFDKIYPIIYFCCCRTMPVY